MYPFIDRSRDYVDVQYNLLVKVKHVECLPNDLFYNTSDTSEQYDFCFVL